MSDLYRSSPNAGMAEFQEKLRLQHENSMHTELEKLLTTAKTLEAEVRPCNLCARSSGASVLGSIYMSNAQLTHVPKYIPTHSYIAEWVMIYT